MRDNPFSLDPGAALLLGLLIFTLRPRELTALIAAAAVHEFGHWICLRWMRVPVCGFSVSLSGPVLCCGEAANRTGQIIAALSGPFAGILFWLACSAFWPLCAELSLVLSLVNLLPILPLDGGMALRTILKNQRFLSGLGFVTASVMVLAGIYAFGNGEGTGLLLFGIWLALLACQGDENDVK